MLSLEGSLPKVGRMTLAQEESLFNVCVRGLLYTILFPSFFRGSLALKNSGECKLMCMYRVRELYTKMIALVTVSKKNIPCGMAVISFEEILKS